MASEQAADNYKIWTVFARDPQTGQELCFPMATEKLARQLASDLVDVTYILAGRPGTRWKRDVFKKATDNA